MSTSGLETVQKTRTRPRPARMQALATLPVFFKLSGQRAVVAGGSAPALWKAELLASAGAQVEVYADAFADGFEALASDPPNGSVRLIRNSWKPADLNGAAIAIGACADDEDAAAFASAARSAGVPVNVIDRPAFCDFQFGAIVNRSPLVMAISTDGGAPVFAQAIRSLVEALLPDTFKRWAEAAKAWRDKGDELGETPAAKRRFWERFAEMAMREGRRRPPSEDDLGELLREPSRASHAVAIIDIGENVESLTLAALRLLRSADLIVFDSGVPPATLDFARREARRLEVPPGANEVADEVVAAARNGDRVVCLVATFAAGPNVDLGKALTEAGASVIMLSSGSIVSE